MIKLISHDAVNADPDAAEDEMNELIKDGWKPLGVLPGFHCFKDTYTDGFIIFHRPDEVKVGAVNPFVEADADDGPVVEAVARLGTDANATLDDFVSMVRHEDFVVLDVETTSRTNPNIVQISIIESDGTVWLDTLVNPLVKISGAAAGIHGISDEAVQDAPTWKTLQPTVREFLKGRNVVIYNAKFDRQAMHESDRTNGLEAVQYKLEATYWDAMLHYAEFNGEWNDYFGNYRWKKLVEAAERFGIETTGSHNALADCQMTLAVIKAMATETSKV